ncbi:hypothetical protein Naga_100083g8 [Nannochloropsis gaditana]|uniref:Uncharacterized protein n=1 Tax=Nannochloropsis gaditana TaxID=72520 RepID=W7U9I6_9STRA|nr:hypothetical protein Naga_100083g8 [Nannochloropsis gaditana]
MEGMALHRSLGPGRRMGREEAREEAPRNGGKIGRQRWSHGTGEESIRWGDLQGYVKARGRARVCAREREWRKERLPVWKVERERKRERARGR